MIKREPITWKELKDICNEMDEKHLNQEVYFWPIDMMPQRITFEKLLANHYISKDDKDPIFIPERVMKTKRVTEQDDFRLAIIKDGLLLFSVDAYNREAERDQIINN